MLRKTIASALTLACGASVAFGGTLTLAIPAQAQSVAKSDAECRLSKNGTVVYEDDCTIKEKLRDGQETFAVKFENGKIFRDFTGFDRFRPLGRSVFDYVW